MKAVIFSSCGALVIVAAVTGAVLAQGTPAPSAGPTLPATDVTNVQLFDFINALPTDKITDAPVRIVDVGGMRVGVYGVFRPKSLPGDAVLHETKTVETYRDARGSGHARHRRRPDRPQARRGNVAR